MTLRRLFAPPPIPSPPVILSRSEGSPGEAARAKREETRSSMSRSLVNELRFARGFFAAARNPRAKRPFEAERIDVQPRRRSRARRMVRGSRRQSCFGGSVRVPGGSVTVRSA